MIVVIVGIPVGVSVRVVDGVIDGVLAVLIGLIIFVTLVELWMGLVDASIFIEAIVVVLLLIAVRV